MRQVAQAEVEAVGPEAVKKWPTGLTTPLDRAAVQLGRSEGWIARAGIPGSADTVARLVRQLRDPDKSVSNNAVQALARLGRASAPVLGAELRRENDPIARQMASYVLTRLGPKAKSVLGELTAALADADLIVRGNAAACLGNCGPGAKTATAALCVAANDSEPVVRRNAIGALMRVGRASDSAFAVLISALRDDSPMVRKHASHAVASLDPAGGRVVRELVGALGDGDAEVRLEVVKALGDMGAKAEGAVTALRALATRRTEPVAVRRAAGEAARTITKGES